MLNQEFYPDVPKDLLQNLEFREVIWELTSNDLEYQREVWIMCKRDILFFFNTFAWLYEPRQAAVLPFVTWGFQDRAILHMQKHLGKGDVGLEKSRDLGATWIFLSVFFHRWLFYKRQAFGLVSRTEDAVDKRDDPDCLMWKLDFLLEHLPAWMTPEFTRGKLSLKNDHTQSTITGYAATQDVARGGRKTAFGMDEMAAFRVDDGFAAWASTQHVTDCRIAVSTPKGLAGIFAEQMNKPDAAMAKIALHWSEHPDKKEGIYRSKDGKLEILDEDYEFPPDYEFVLDGKLRSPWYDEECRRHPVPALIAQELDIDYGGSGFPFFNHTAIEAHARQYSCNPFQRGEIDFDTELYDPHWHAKEQGRLALWLHLTSDNTPPKSQDYVIGCDIATGVGGDESTNSVASIAVESTGEKVGELTIGDLAPDKFAEYVTALRKWFQGPSGDAYLAWEDNGPGLQFRKQILKISNHRLYYRENEKVVTRKRTKMPGWHSSRETKRVLLGEYGRAITDGTFVNRSGPALEEMLHYTHLPTGAIEHDRSQATLDPTASGENHGDRVIADALANRICDTSRRNDVRSDKKPKVVPYGSMAWREELALAAEPKDEWL